ncbi:hypothetical protein L1987_46245 [Smallanthus sonchifolius]|uniref:Uncharacterized protein n=2 Tax=Smallanthus sonchifolius TaxID=185202 RepID=A0ACB9FZU3_9ASTR|nr:hypothetical protein L1987_46243 [Smallanthus sonchifolius]KAI3776460.1 hypothetical protein L1987_46245 [Smallanthus sonchifolius]
MQEEPITEASKNHLSEPAHQAPLDDGFVHVKRKRYRKKKPKAAGPNGMTSDSGVDLIPVGPSVSLGSMDNALAHVHESVNVGVLDNQAPPSVDLVSSSSHMAGPLQVSQAHLKLKGKINVSNQFASLDN